ncbi:MAG TPA: MFS transporter [Terracidiphilus sp.]|nr:MFS transporter [Terracidiphilus sp.]
MSQTISGVQRVSFYSGIRSRVLGMTVALAFLTYMDRVCISVTAPAMMRDLRLTPLQMGFAFSAFTAAYAFFEIPTGWWADRIGSRKVLTRIVVWWSIFTGLTATAWNFPSLLTFRALFGAGEAGAWPTVTRALSRWFPVEERGTAQGIFFMGAHLGGGAAPLLVTALASWIGWRRIFPVLSLLGFFWALFWFKQFKDNPEDHNAISGEELAWIRKGVNEEDIQAKHISAKEHSILRTALCTPGIWCLCLMYFTQTYGFNLYVTWLPTYLSHDKKLQGMALGFLAGLPLLLSVVADLFGGLVTDKLSSRYGLRFGRCIVGFGSLAAAGVLLILGSLLTGWISAVLVALAAASSNFLLGASWGTCADIGGKHAATLSAAMNTSGQIGGVLSPIVFALLTRNRISWSAPLYWTAGLYLLGSVSWAFIHPDRPLNAITNKNTEGRELACN